MLKALWDKISIDESERKPAGPFIRKAALTISLVLTCSILGMNAFASRYEFAIDTMMVRCLPDHMFYLVDREVLKPESGDLYQFKAKGIQDHLDPEDEIHKPLYPHFADGVKILKVVDGVPGDHIKITKEGVFVNGVQTGAPGLALHKTLRKPESYFEREFVLAENEYFFAGRTFDSFDGRYWGTVNADQIVGKATPIF